MSQIIVKGCGGAVSNAVFVAEHIKRNVIGLH